MHAGRQTSKLELMSAVTVSGMVGIDNAPLSCTGSPGSTCDWQCLLPTNQAPIKSYSEPP
ncbi:hypothetical protein SERLADRAFT_366329 [Serpula lacrymans var. lacrymans S7.9]|uniref:Uncharacterized protein n=1 Tax=Serpula lacrymans var. lacrymans (strain S7.9) TaxID=578457 RepID=F8NLR4_SERL9|nr:uncharacterized protein SERLADRAFT_366329 [Serpula lacrymans var. lacrymans S7.9]EGO28616.1 hypothetical protein SERLADRAFT_366329 [Serpula lacrymans var. lacrymans S7.9]